MLKADLLALIADLPDDADIRFDQPTHDYWRIHLAIDITAIDEVKVKPYSSRRISATVSLPCRAWPSIRNFGFPASPSSTSSVCEASASSSVANFTSYIARTAERSRDR